MRLNVMIVGISHETWFRGTRDERQVSLLNCLDRDAFLGIKFKQTFDYAPSAEELEKLDLEKLDGVMTTLAVQEIKPTNGGRLKMSGKLDMSTLPKEAVHANGNGSPVKTPPGK